MDNIQLADLQLLLQVMIGSSPSHQSEEQLSYFLCTCGAEFELYQEYYSHLMQEMGMSQQKPIHHQSSNYSNFQIVSAVKFEQESGSQECQEQTIIEEGYKNQEEDLKQESSEDEQSIQNEHESFANPSLVAPYKRNRRCFKRWNDFLLVKNHKCKEGPFYCGNCEIIYFKIEDFISHCVQQCHSFQHTASSHFITDENQQNKRKYILKKKSRLQRISKIALQQQSVMDQVQCEPFNEIFRQHWDHKNQAFYCGICQYNFQNYQGFIIHIAQVHQQAIDPSSSHVILRFAYFTEKYRLNFLYISPHISWVNEVEKYYCSCQPKVKITMAQLLKHVQEQHNGISPIYHGKYIYVKPQKKARMNEINEGLIQEEAEDYVLFKRIYDNRCDHRDIQFFCGGCQFKTKNPSSYCHHMKHYSHGSKINRGSHVILRVIDKCESIGNIYLSPTVEWENEEAIYFCACDVHTKMKMKDLIQHVYVQHNGISPYYPLSSLARLHAKYDQYFQKSVKDETIKSIISLHMVIKQGSFGCKKCKNISINNPTAYAKHIMRVHNRIVDPKHHTHILIQAKYDKWQLTHYFYLPVLSQFQDGSLKYYCPCQHDHKMSINGLIDHILKQHNGVSPTYSLDQ